MKTMKLNRRAALRLGSLAGLLPLASCGDLLEDVVGACIDLDGPTFNTPGLPNATVGQPYSAQVEAAITREPYDDRFLYRFRLSGSLPPGLGWAQAGRTRRLQISGTPTAAGSYSFRFEVSVEDPLETPEVLRTLCWYATDKTYQLGVASGG